MNQQAAVSPHEGQSVDLTTSQYWDEHLGAAGPSVGQRMSLRSIITSLVGRRSALLYDLLGAQLDQLAQQRGAAKLRVLEVGCAPGGILEAMMNRSPQHEFAGVDFSTDGIRDTRQRFQTKARSPMIYQADVREFQPDELFDYVYSCGLIEHFTDPVPMLKEHMRLCRPGGKVVLTVPNYSGALQRFCMARLSPLGWRSHNIAVMSEPALRDLATRAGLQNIQTGRFGKHALRTICEVHSPTNTVIKAAAQIYSVAARFAPQAAIGPLKFWVSGEVAESAK